MINIKENYTEWSMTGNCGIYLIFLKVVESMPVVESGQLVSHSKKPCRLELHSHFFGSDQLVNMLDIEVTDLLFLKERHLRDFLTMNNKEFDLALGYTLYILLIQKNLTHVYYLLFRLTVVLLDTFPLFFFQKTSNP